jgi:hypothetical protein
MKPSKTKKEFKNSKPNCKSGEVKEGKKKYKDYSNPKCKCGDIGDIKSISIYALNEDGSLGSLISFKNFD